MVEANLHMTLEEFSKRMNEPGVMSRLRLLSPKDAEAILLEGAQFLRVERGDRARPDLLPNNATYKPSAATQANRAGLPDMYMPEDTHRPDLSPEDIAATREPWQRLHDEMITELLQEQMGTDRDLPLEEPTLRDQIEAASALYDDGE